MALLKKIRASTLMETMLATVLIVVLFLMASLIINANIESTVRGNTQPITAYLQQLEYGYINKKINIPYYEEWGNWNIETENITLEAVTYIIFEATHQKTAKKVKSVLKKNEP